MPDVFGSCPGYEAPQLRPLTWLPNARIHRRERTMVISCAEGPAILHEPASQTSPKMETDTGTSPETLPPSIYSGGITSRASTETLRHVQHCAGAEEVIPLLHTTYPSHKPRQQSRRHTRSHNCTRKFSRQNGGGGV